MVVLSHGYSVGHNKLLPWRLCVHHARSRESQLRAVSSVLVLVRVSNLCSEGSSFRGKKEPSACRVAVIREIRVILCKDQLSFVFLHVYNLSLRRSLFIWRIPFPIGQPWCYSHDCSVRHNKQSSRSGFAVEGGYSGQMFTHEQAF